MAEPTVFRWTSCILHTSTCADGSAASNGPSLFLTSPLFPWEDPHFGCGLQAVNATKNRLNHLKLNIKKKKRSQFYNLNLFPCSHLFFCVSIPSCSVWPLQKFPPDYIFIFPPPFHLKAHQSSWVVTFHQDVLSLVEFAFSWTCFFLLESVDLSLHFAPLGNLLS